jgi:hypothetical protein
MVSRRGACSRFRRWPTRRPDEEPSWIAPADVQNSPVAQHFGSRSTRPCGGGRASSRRDRGTAGCQRFRRSGRANFSIPTASPVTTTGFARRGCCSIPPTSTVRGPSPKSGKRSSPGSEPVRCHRPGVPGLACVFGVESLIGQNLGQPRVYRLEIEPPSCEPAQRAESAYPPGVRHVPVPSDEPFATPQTRHLTCFSWYPTDVLPCRLQ